MSTPVLRITARALQHRFHSSPLAGLSSTDWVVVGRWPSYTAVTSFSEVRASHLLKKFVEVIAEGAMEAEAEGSEFQGTMQVERLVARELLRNGIPQRHS